MTEANARPYASRTLRLLRLAMEPPILRGSGQHRAPSDGLVFLAFVHAADVGNRLGESITSVRAWTLTLCLLLAHSRKPTEQPVYAPREAGSCANHPDREHSVHDEFEAAAVLRSDPRSGEHKPVACTPASGRVYTAAKNTGQCGRRCQRRVACAM